MASYGKGTTQGPSRSTRQFFQGTMKPEASFFDNNEYQDRGELERIKTTKLGKEVTRQNLSLETRKRLRENL